MLTMLTAAFSLWASWCLMQPLLRSMLPSLVWMGVLAQVMPPKPKRAFLPYTFIHIFSPSFWLMHKKISAPTAAPTATDAVCPARAFVPFDIR
jgi:hypothetical protein